MCFSYINLLWNIFPLQHVYLDNILNYLNITIRFLEGHIYLLPIIISVSLNILVCCINFYFLSVKPRSKFAVSKDIVSKLKDMYYQIVLLKGQRDNSLYPVESNVVHWGLFNDLFLSDFCLPNKCDYFCLVTVWCFHIYCVLNICYVNDNRSLGNSELTLSVLFSFLRRRPLSHLCNDAS